jgi:hypothetical protein
VVGDASSSPTGSTRPASPTAIPSPAVIAEPSTASISPSPEPTPRTGAAEVAWTRGSGLDGTSAVAERIGDNWFIGGSMVVNGAQQAAIWTSADGQTWDGPALLPPEPPPKPTDQPENEPWFPERYRVTALAEWEDALYAFGIFQFGCCDGYLPMLWQSVDGGATWSEVVTEGTAFRTAQIPLESTTAPTGELAVFSLTGLGGSASMYITSDLQAWTDHPIPRGDSDALLEFGGLASSPRMMVVVGYDIPPFREIEERRPTQRAWQSADGRMWSPLAPPQMDGELWDVTWDPTFRRWVLVGTDDTGRPRVWLSSDGVSWATSQLSHRQGRVHDIAAADGLIGAVGAVGTSPTSEGIRTVWSSHDAVTWSVATLEGSAQFADGTIALTGASGVVAFGPSGPGSETWIGRPTE